MVGAGVVVGAAVVGVAVVGDAVVVGRDVVGADKTMTKTGTKLTPTNAHKHALKMKANPPSQKTKGEDSHCDCNCDCNCASSIKLSTRPSLRPRPCEVSKQFDYYYPA